jgi:dethiobiotin synthetase
MRGFYRAKAPVSPYAALLLGEPPCPAPRVLVATILGAAKAARAQALLVEGAGGLLVPLDAAMTVADIAVELAYPLVLVARNELGTLSATLTAERAAMLAGLDLRAVILNRPPGTPDDASQSTNARILRERLMCPVLDTADADWAQALVAELF